MDPELQLIDRIPPEVWTLILEYLESDPASLYSCYKARSTGVWRDILSEKTRYLFPLVIPKLHEEFTSQELVDLRGVCKTWKAAVDKTLETTSLPAIQGPATTAYRNVHAPEDEWFKNFVGTTFSNADHITEFQTQMKDCKTNPFLNQTVKIIEEKLNTSAENARMYRSFTKLIETHGDQIKTCIYFADGSVPECNRQMPQIFRHLRNLRCLIVTKTYYWGNEDDDIAAEMEESLQWLRYPERLPPLEHLQSLNLFMDSKPLCDLLLTRYGPQLVSLQVEMDAIESCPFFNDPPIARHSLENLRSLKVVGTYGDSSLLQRVSVFHLPHLERLYLNYTEVGRRLCNIKYLIRLINQCASTLQELRIPFNMFIEDINLLQYSNSNECDNDLGVTLPHVTWLGVPYGEIGYGIFDKVLQKFPNLTHLHVMNFDVYFSDKMIECEELHEVTDHFWEKMPSLKKITVEEEKLNKIIFQSTRTLVQFRKEMRTYSDSSLEINLGNSESDDE